MGSDLKLAIPKSSNVSQPAAYIGPENVLDFDRKSNMFYVRRAKGIILNLARRNNAVLGLLAWDFKCKNVALRCTKLSATLPVCLLSAEPVYF